MNIGVIIVYTLMITVNYKIKKKHKASGELWYIKLSLTHYTSSQPGISCEKQ